LVTVQWGDVIEALAEFGPGVPEEPERWERYRDPTRMRVSLSAQLASFGTCRAATTDARPPPKLAAAPLRGRGMTSIWLRASRTKLLDAWLALPPELRERFNELLDAERGR
jgi:hypothetical protein